METTNPPITSPSRVSVGKNPASLTDSAISLGISAADLSSIGLAPTTPILTPARSQSRLAGHVLSARDRYTPIRDAKIRIHTRHTTTQAEGLYEIPLDSLPAVVDVEIDAPGFYVHREQMSWVHVASGGLILRDFILIPSDMPLVRTRMSGQHPVRTTLPPVVPVHAPPPPDEEEELDLEDIDEEEEEALFDGQESDDDAWTDSDDSEDLDWEERQLHGTFDDEEIFSEPSLEPAFAPTPRR